MSNQTKAEIIPLNRKLNKYVSCDEAVEFFCNPKNLYFSIDELIIIINSPGVYKINGRLGTVWSDMLKLKCLRLITLILQKFASYDVVSSPIQDINILDSLEFNTSYVILSHNQKFALNLPELYLSALRLGAAGLNERINNKILHQELYGTLSYNNFINSMENDEEFQARYDRYIIAKENIDKDNSLEGKKMEQASDFTRQQSIRRLNKMEQASDFTRQKSEITQHNERRSSLFLTHTSITRNKPIDRDKDEIVESVFEEIKLTTDLKSKKDICDYLTIFYDKFINNKSPSNENIRKFAIQKIKYFNDDNKEKETSFLSALVNNKCPVLLAILKELSQRKINIGGSNDLNNLYKSGFFRSDSKSFCLEYLYNQLISNDDFSLIDYNLLKKYCFDQMLINGQSGLIDTKYNVESKFDVVKKSGKLKNK